MNDSIWVVAESAAQTRFPSPVAVSSTTGRPLANAVTADDTESLSAVGLLMSARCPAGPLCASLGIRSASTGSCHNQHA